MKQAIVSQALPAQPAYPVKYQFGNWKFDYKTNKLTLCQKANAILGFDVATAVDIKKVFRLMDAACLAKLTGWMRESCRAGVLEPAIFDFKTNLGQPLTVKITGFHYPGDWDGLDIIVGVIEDITETINEERVALSIINHEMRTPLSVMKLNAQMIQRAKRVGYPISAEDMALNIERHIEGLTNILDQYLSGTNTAGDVGNINPSVFDLETLVERVLTDMRGMHPGYKFGRLFKCSGLVTADRYLIMQALINILTNAIKFSPEGSQIIVQARSRAGQLVLSVIDKGPGISPGDEEKIFNRFYKSGGNKKTEGASRGLGLYLVKQIIEKHNGRIWAERGQIKGSVFSFSLPKAVRLVN